MNKWRIYPINSCLKQVIIIKTKLKLYDDENYNLNEEFLNFQYLILKLHQRTILFFKIIFDIIHFAYIILYSFSPLIHLLFITICTVFIHNFCWFSPISYILKIFHVPNILIFSFILIYESQFPCFKWWHTTEIM